MRKAACHLCAPGSTARGRYDANCDGCTARQMVKQPKHLRIAAYKAIVDSQGMNAAIAMKAAVEKLWQERQTKGSN